MGLSELVSGRARPVLVQFHAPWCGPCKALSPRVDSVATEFADTVDLERIDVDAHPDLAKEAGVRGVPTLVVFRDGKEIRRHTGTLDREGLRTLFRSPLDEESASRPVDGSAWPTLWKFLFAMVVLAASGQIPSIEWTRWIGMGMLVWAMRDLCPACRTR